MSLRERAEREHPDFPWLSSDDEAGVARFLAERGWLDPGEELRSCSPAGEGNMNLTIRVETDRRSFVLKQARPWVEKYDHIPAPWERTLFELRFYERTALIEEVARHTPNLLASDTEARVILLEDLPGARDMTTLYTDDGFLPSEIDDLARVLRALHDATEGRTGPEFANREMRQLNHEHIFEIPLAEDNGLDLEGFESGLSEVADILRRDAAYRRAVAETGARYLADGSCLVHGDYFPGSWLRSDVGLRVIDPEFCFGGDREVDLGCAVAHFALAQQGSAAAQRLLSTYEADGNCSRAPWIARFAACEVMRRLIGVAQLPIPPTQSGGRLRRDLLERSRRAMLEAEQGEGAIEILTTAN